MIDRLKVKVAPAIYCGTRAYESEVKGGESVKSLKDEICKSEMIPSFMVRLFFKGKMLDENTSIKNLGIKEGDMLQLIIMT